MKLSRGFLLLILLQILFIFSSTVVEANSCVVKPVKPYEINSQCFYSDPPEDVNYYDPCYQQYLVMKSDYETRCFRYWDEKKNQQESDLLKKSLVSPEPQQSPQLIEKTSVNEVVKENPKPFFIPKKIKPSPLVLGNEATEDQNSNLSSQGQSGEAVDLTTNDSIQPQESFFKRLMPKIISKSIIKSFPCQKEIENPELEKHPGLSAKIRLNKLLGEIACDNEVNPEACWVKKVTENPLLAIPTTIKVDSTCTETIGQEKWFSIFGKMLIKLNG